MPQIKVLISGGGVAGTALAFWLSKLGHDVTVVEWFSSLRTTGLQIDLRDYGIEVLRRMGLEQAFRDRAAPEEGMQFVDSSGRKRAYFGANKTGKGGQGITSEFEIMRGDLCRIIHDATENRAKYVYGTSIARFEQTGPKVHVVFRNGEKDSYDLVVGADGVWSATRKMLLGSQADETFHSLGEYNAYLTIRRPIEKGERYIGQMYLAPQKRAILVRRHSPDEIQLYLLLNREDKQFDRILRGDVEREKAAFTEIFKDAGWRAPELLEAMQDSNDFYCERLGVVKMDPWYQGHVALVGDAAYAPGGSGMGTTCAIVGAYVLAGEIGRHCGSCAQSDAMSIANSIDDALKAYDKIFRPYVENIHKGQDSSAGSYLFPTTPFGIMVFHWISTIFSMIWLDPVAQWFMKSTLEKEFPEYEQLRRVQEKSTAW